VENTIWCISVSHDSTDGNESGGDDDHVEHSVNQTSNVLPSSPTSSECKTTYAAMANETCTSIANAFSVSLPSFNKLNSDILDCQSNQSAILPVGLLVCLERLSVVNGTVLTVGGGQDTEHKITNTTTTISSCTKNITSLSSSDSCSSLSKQYNVSVSSLSLWNPNLNCWSLQRSNATYCVERNVTVLAALEESAKKSKSTSTSTSTELPKQTSHAAEKPKPTNPPSPPPPPPSTSPDFASAVVEAHNYYRKMYKVPPLQWSDSLYRGASSWVQIMAREHGCFQHSNPAVGENIFMWSPVMKTYSNLARSAVTDYMKEPLNVMMHSTQVLWGKTRFVACAFATGNGCTGMVCRYDPPGNFVGQRWYDV
jgi:hypothetical protein